MRVLSEKQRIEYNATFDRVIGKAIREVQMLLPTGKCDVTFNV